jgi:hypothetical protein
VTKVHKVALSDHYMPVTTIKENKIKQVHKTVTFRDYKKFDEQNFINMVKNSQDMSSILTSTDINLSWKKWSGAFLEISNKCAPIKTMRRKSTQQRWISPDIVKEMNRRDHLHAKACRNKDSEIWNLYRKARNKVNKMIKNAKVNHYNNLIEQNKHNPKKFWAEMAKIVPNKINFNSIPNSISADDFNYYFSTVGLRTVTDNNINQTMKNGDLLWKGPTSLYTFKLSHVSECNIIKCLKNLPNTPNMDVLGIDSKLLKLATTEIAPQLTHLFNLSIDSSHVPPDWKLARVTPVYKGKGDINDKGNYRPISVVCHVGKLMEKQIHEQFLAYLECHNFISKDQSAYLKGHSTTTCLHKVVDDWLEAMDEGEVMAVCFLDNYTKMF